MVINEKDEELTLFLEMKRRERAGGGKIIVSEPIAKTVSFTHHQQPRRTAADKFLDSENDKSDYDWLLTPPGTPLQMQAPKPLIDQIMSNTRSTALKSRLTNVQEEPISKGTVASKRTSLASRTNFPMMANRRPSSTAEPTPTTRPRSSTPTAGRPIVPATTKASRSSTPTSHATLPLNKPAAPPMRSSTPTRTAPRSSTPTSRPSVLTSKSSSRSATPTRQRSDPSKLPKETTSYGRSASVSKAAPTILKNAASSLASLPTSKSRPWKPDEMPGFSLDAPPNLRTTLPERPASASRGRPGNTNTQSLNEAGLNGRPRRQSCSPAKGRASIGNASAGKISFPIKSKVQTKSGDDVNPVLMGTIMVERVVNMRKLVPPKHDDNQPTHSITNGKSSSLDGSGFGCSISKKSLDMAMRHMDIRRTVTSNLRPLITSIPASSMYSVRSVGSTKGRTTSASDSPLGTRSDASSEPSVNNNPYFVDGLELEDNFTGIER